MPARAPASIDMLQTVSRSSTLIARSAAPAYSTTWPTAPPAPIFAMIARITSLALTPSGRRPSTVIRIVLCGACQMVCVASTCSFSDCPIPNAKAPSAPWVEVWLSPQTSRSPGSVMPCSGPMMCTIPWRSSSR
jgi:hypothetical protein